MKNILVIAGPSAVGKTTAAHALLKQEPRFEFVRSVTTREKRGDAYDGEYIYLDRAEFDRALADGGVLEYTEYAGAVYGTPRSEIDRIIEKGKIPLLILDLNGVVSIAKNSGDINPCQVYIYDDISVMEKRLFDRYVGENPSEEGKRKFYSRKAQNIADYSKLPDISSHFYAFLPNKGTVADMADLLLGAFEQFDKGVPRDEGKIEVTVRKIASFAKQ